MGLIEALTMMQFAIHIGFVVASELRPDQDCGFRRKIRIAPDEIDDSACLFIRRPADIEVFILTSLQPWTTTVAVAGIMCRDLANNELRFEFVQDMGDRCQWIALFGAITQEP